MFKGSNIIITGGTGTLGKELTKQLLDYDCKEIVIFSRSEVAQVEMRRLFPTCSYVIGDIRDVDVVRSVFTRADIVYHLAAIKHVSICEMQPAEAIKTNIIGTQNILAHSKRVVFMSTDKAVNPTSIYGYTKAIAEKLVVNAGATAVRSGNIFGSSGSVIPLFINQVKTKNTILLTNGEMTRFFIPVDKLAKFILERTEANIPGICWPLNMDAFKMQDVAEVVKELFGNKDTKIIEIGVVPGEKLHESVNGITYSNNCLADKELLKEMFNDSINNKFQ